MNRRLILCCLALTLLAGSGSPCSCIPIPLQDQFDRAVDIFVGRAVAVELAEGGCTPEGSDRWTFKKSGYWKGSRSSVGFVTTSCMSSMCGYGFELDQEYIVFANYDEYDQVVYTHLCSATADTRWASQDLWDFLGTPETDVVSGRTSSWSTLKSRY